MITMNEQKAQERIHQAVTDSLSWLDELPSQEAEILKRTNKEACPLITVYHGKNHTVTEPAYTPARTGMPVSRFRPILAMSAVIVLIAGLWMIRHNANISTPLDTVTQPLSSQVTPGSSDTVPLPAAVSTENGNESQTGPLDRIDLYVEPDLLWNNDTGILAEGDQAEKKPGQLPFKNTVYRKMQESGAFVDGELVYQSEEGAVLFRDRITLQLDDETFSIDMPQKSFLINAADGSFDYPLFDDRTTSSYPSILLRNSGNDSMWTRVQDGVQHRLIERDTDAHLLTQAWRPVQVYLNNEYWGMYNMREPIDAHTICRYEQIPDEMAEDVTILPVGGSYATQGSSTSYKEMLKRIKNSKPAENAEDLEYLEQEIDIDSFLDWLTVEMYFGNSDIGNGKIYRIPGGKWKCLIEDLDYALYNSAFNSVQSYLKPAGMGERQLDNTIFLKILEVDKYRELFFTKLGILFHSLTSEVMFKELDACIAWIEPGMKAHIDRWAPYYDKNILAEVPTDPEQAWTYWQKRVFRLRNVMHKRPTLLYGFIQDYFGMSDEEMAVYFPTDIPSTVTDLSYPSFN